MQSGRATCTGLSIILVDACRAVGIPARAVGTPMWSNGRGNHTWVEIWDGDWHFLGADEYDPKGLDRGWFNDDAARAQADNPEHAIYATSWKRDQLTFPMVWAAGVRDVGAVNVTARYAKTATNPGVARLGIRLFDQKGGERLVAKIRVIPGGVSTVMETKAGNSDLNDMPRFELKPDTKGRVFFTANGERVLELDQLEKADSGGYVHMSRIYDGLGHWMNRRDAEALPWMARFSRNPWPEKIVWLQDDVVHDRFYWLKIPDLGAALAGQKIVATVAGQTIRLDGDVPPKTELWLSDKLLDLGQTITVSVNDKPPLTTNPARTAGAIRRSLEERIDVPAAATAVVAVP